MSGNLLEIILSPIKLTVPRIVKCRHCKKTFLGWVGFKEGRLVCLSCARKWKSYCMQEYSYAYRMERGEREIVRKHTQPETVPVLTEIFPASENKSRRLLELEP